MSLKTVNIVTFRLVNVEKKSVIMSTKKLLKWIITQLFRMTVSFI